MRRSYIARGHLITEMLVQTGHDVALGLGLADTGGMTMVTPKAAKSLAPAQRMNENIVGLGQVVHKVETFKADLVVKMTQNPPTFRTATGVNVGVIPGLAEDQDEDRNGFHMFLGAEAMQQLSVGVDPVNKCLIDVVKTEETNAREARAKAQAEEEVSKSITNEEKNLDSEIHKEEKGKATELQGDGLPAAFALPVGKMRQMISDYKKTHKPLSKESFFE